MSEDDEVRLWGEWEGGCFKDRGCVGQGATKGALRAGKNVRE